MKTKSKVSPERLAQLAEMRAKAAANREARKAEAATQINLMPGAEPVVVEEPMSLADLGLAAEEFRIDDILSNEEIADIEAAAEAKAEAEMRNERKKKFAALALDRARRKVGAMPIEEERQKETEEMVRISIRMPQLKRPNGAGLLPPEPIIIDQKIFVHGRDYEVPRGQGEMLLWIMDRQRQHAAQVDGVPKTYYSESIGTMVYQGGIATGGGQPGMSFAAVHRRPAA